MRKKSILITGAAGEIGDALIMNLAENDYNQIVTLDLKELPPEITAKVTHVQGDILDQALLARLVSEYEINTIYHLAALLSTRAEFTPEAAHKVNVEGTMGLLRLALEQSNGVEIRSCLSSLARSLPMECPTWKSKQSSPMYENGSGITRAPCTDVTNCTAKCWVYITASIIVNWRQIVL